MYLKSDSTILESTQRIFEEQRQQIFRRTDRMFAVLMVLQWLGGIAAACILTPRTWTGSQSEIHPHVHLAVFLGGILAGLPVFLAWRYPGRLLTRHVIGITQMLFSSLLIHISGGRIETHFHVFGSLAFLAFYRDWPVLIPATVLVALDHYVRGVYWPETVYGIATSSPWRWMEHAAWVVFEDIFLIVACHQGVIELWNTARRTAELEWMNFDFQTRTIELEHAYNSRNAVVQTALDAVIGMDIEGHITDWNSQAERTFGWAASEVIGRQVAETIIPMQFRANHLEGLNRFRETGISVVLNRRIEISAIGRDGREFPVELAIAPIRAGKEFSFCAFVRDITERKQAAEALCRAKDAAEAANRAKSAFLAHMSHEIRTPLNGILGFADVLLKLGADATEAERREYIETINHSGRHLLELISDVLDLSKIESGQMDVEKVRCAPHEVIADAISILRVRAQEKGINLEYGWKGPVPETIETDPSRFRQLLMNLIGNAIKFTEHGTVEVIARIEQNSDAPGLAVDVADTGIGIPPEYLERIFEPFTQADQSITRRFGGTGLGLSISRQIAQLLGGGLTAESEVGRGSRFTASVATGSLIGIRLLEAPVADLIPRKDPEPRMFRALPNASILLVEDGVTNRKLISLMLRRAGIEVTTAANGQIGLDLVGTHNFDLVLMDMQMPVMDGYLAATEMRRRGISIPIIALTAHSMKGDEERCRAAGCSGYVTKPIDSDRLLNVVGEVLLAAQDARQGSASSSAGPLPLVSTLPMDDPEFQEIVEDLVLRLNDQVAGMRRAAAEEDYSALAQLAHWLKGSAGTAGFGMLTSPAMTLEQAAKERNASAITDSLDRIAGLVARIVVPRRSPSMTSDDKTECVLQS
jgi:PAS domain S-box-containing protein